MTMRSRFITPPQSIPNSLPVSFRSNRLPLKVITALYCLTSSLNWSRLTPLTYVRTVFPSNMIIEIILNRLPTYLRKPVVSISKKQYSFIEVSKSSNEEDSIICSCYSFSFGLTLNNFTSIYLFFFLLGSSLVSIISILSWSILNSWCRIASKKSSNILYSNQIWLGIFPDMIYRKYSY